MARISVMELNRGEGRSVRAGRGECAIFAKATHSILCGPIRIVQAFCGSDSEPPPGGTTAIARILHLHSGCLTCPSSPATGIAGGARFVLV